MLKMSTTSTIIWRNGTSMLSWHLLGFWSYFEVLTVFPCCFEIPSDPKPEKDELCDLYVLQELCWSGRGWTHLGDLSEIDCEWQERGLWWRNAPSAIFALFSGLQHLLHECIPEKKKSHLSSSLLHSSLAFFFAQNPWGVLTCPWEAGGKERVWCEWKRKGLGRFSDESPARTSAKGAGDCNGTEERWGRVWKISVTALPCPEVLHHPLLLQEGMLTRSPQNFKPRLRNDRRKASGDSDCVWACGLRGKFDSPGVGTDTPAFGVNFTMERAKPRTSRCPAGTISLPSALLQTCWIYMCCASLHPGGCSKSIRLHPQPSQGCSPCLPARRRGLGLQKSPARSIMQPLGRAAKRGSKIPTKSL